MLGIDSTAVGSKGSSLMEAIIQLIRTGVSKLKLFKVIRGTYL